MHGASIEALPRSRDHGPVSDAPCQVRSAEADDAEALMSAFERWAAARDCALIALATRRAAPFYRALGYEESAVYFRKVLGE